MIGSRHVPLTLRTDTNPPKKLVSVSVAECNSALRGSVTPTPDTEEELGGWSGGTGGGSGGMDVKAMIGEAKRRSDQRLNTDHQYLHRQAFACVRVGPTGFVWLSNNTGKVKKRMRTKSYRTPNRDSEFRRIA